MKRRVKAWTYIMSDGKWSEGTWYVVEAYATKAAAERALSGAYAIQIVRCVIEYDDGKRPPRRKGAKKWGG